MEKRGRRKKFRHRLYKVIGFLLVLNAIKWVQHPFGLNMAQFFNNYDRNFFLLELLRF